MPLPAWPPAWGARAGDPGLCTDAFSGYLWQGRGSLVLGRLRSRPRGSLRTPQGLERAKRSEEACGRGRAERRARGAARGGGSLTRPVARPGSPSRMGGAKQGQTGWALFSFQGGSGGAPGRGEGIRWPGQLAGVPRALRWLRSAAASASRAGHTAGG